MKFAFVSNMDGSPWGGSEDLWAGTAERLYVEDAQWQLVE